MEVGSPDFGGGWEKLGEIGDPRPSDTRASLGKRTIACRRPKSGRASPKEGECPCECAPPRKFVRLLTAATMTIAALP